MIEKFYFSLFEYANWKRKREYKLLFFASKTVIFYEMDYATRAGRRMTLSTQKAFLRLFLLYQKGKVVKHVTCQ